LDANRLRQRKRRLLGPFPKRVHLRPPVGEVIDEGEHNHARITCAVEVGERALNWLLTHHEAAPTGGWPALLAIHQCVDQ
jgi:hypothetical protein